MISILQQIKTATFNFNQEAEKYGLEGDLLTKDLIKITNNMNERWGGQYPDSFGSLLQGFRAQTLVAMLRGWNPLDYIKELPYGRADEFDFILKDSRRLDVKAKNGKKRKYARDDWDIGLFAVKKKSDVYLIVYYWDDYPDDFTLLGWIDGIHFQRFFVPKNDWARLKKLSNYPPKDFGHRDDGWILHGKDLNPPLEILSLIKIPKKSFEVNQAFASSTDLELPEKQRKLF